MHEENARRLKPALHLSKQIGPHVERAMKNLIIPERIERRPMRGLKELAELAPSFPHRADRLLHQVERSETTLRARFKEAEDFLSLVNRLATRIVLAILAAGFVVGIAVLSRSIIPLRHSAPLQPAIGWLLIGGLVGSWNFPFWLVGCILSAR